MSIINIHGYQTKAYQTEKKAETSKSVFQRVEKKYLLTQEQYDGFKAEMLRHMTLDQYGLSTISSIYFDSDSFDLIRKSISKPVYKEKFRLRGYGSVNNKSTVYAEIKKKYDGIVYKRRQEIPEKMFLNWDYTTSPFPIDTQIGKEIDYLFRRNSLRPKVYIGYDREAYFGNDNHSLRVTVDRNLRYRTENLDLRAGAYGNPLLDKGTYLMEIKIPGALPLWMIKTMEKLNIRPVSFSKVGYWYENYRCDGITTKIEENNNMKEAI